MVLDSIYFLFMLFLIQIINFSALFFSAGTEALFADLSHFPVLAIQVNKILWYSWPMSHLFLYWYHISMQIAFTTIVFPCLLLAYIGQAAYLVGNRDHVSDAFYRAIPGLLTFNILFLLFSSLLFYSLLFQVIIVTCFVFLDSIYWPMFIVATAAAIIASQATISATFSIIKQALALGCFPKVKVVHTSKKFLGHIYIPDINWVLMIACIAVTVGFKNQSQIGNAYGKFAQTLFNFKDSFLLNSISKVIICCWIHKSRWDIIYLNIENFLSYEYQELQLW